MNKNGKITGLGHSCFLVESEGFSVLIDPYKDGKVPGLAPLKAKANRILCSHDHEDHGWIDAVEEIKSDENPPFALSLIACPHDDQGGSLRGMNLIHILDNGNLRIAHFGDIGCPLNDMQKKMVGQLDVAMIPVGGYYTMEQEGILNLIEELSPRVVIPMHYRTKDFGFAEIKTLDEFLAKREDVIFYETNTVEITKEMPAQTAILTYLA